MVDLTGKESSLIITKTTTTTAANNYTRQDIRGSGGLNGEGWWKGGLGEAHTGAYLLLPSGVGTAGRGHAAARGDAGGPARLGVLGRGLE